MVTSYSSYKYSGSYITQTFDAKRDYFLKNITGYSGR